MALVDLKSNLANFRAEFVTPSVELQAIKRLDQPSPIKTQFLPNDSRLDVDVIPDSYNGRTKFTKPFVDRSIFNRDDEFILKYTGRTRFTPRFINTSKFNVDDNPEKFINSGFNRLSVPRFINRSQFNIDSIPTKFSPGMFIPTKFTDKKVINASKYNLDDNPDKYINVGLRRLSLPRFINRSLLNIDSTLSKFSPTGVYAPTRYTDTNVINVSKYNLDDTPTKYGNDSNKTKYKGISGNSFKFPALLTAVFRTNAVELKNSKFGSRGFATVENQLGAGSLFHYTINGAKNNKLFSSRGYAEQLKYGDVVRGGRGWQGVNSLLFQKATEQNSPSAIEEQYKKFNLRDEAYNYSYINHPLILRGIQRKGKEEPNRWGIDGVVNFDSGLVRGGITAATEIAANDTVRISKWLASPKGLLWSVKQLGLGLSNPKVEATGGPLTRLTRIHTGVASLLSVPTTAFGLHFTRHGIPIANEVASYENVINLKNQTYQVPGIGNRLIGLRTEYQVGLQEGGLLDVSNDTFTQTIVSRLRTSFNLGPNAFGSTLLSGLGGAQSVYGIGFTAIRRAANTVEKAKENANQIGYPTLNGFYGIRSGYKSSQKGFNSAVEGGFFIASKEQGDITERASNLAFLYDRFRDKDSNPIVSDLNNSESRPMFISMVNRFQINNIYKPTLKLIRNNDSDETHLVRTKKYQGRAYAHSLRANTGKTTDTYSDKSDKDKKPKPDTKPTPEARVIDDGNGINSDNLKSIYNRVLDAETPTANLYERSVLNRPTQVEKPNPFNREVLNEGGGTHKLEFLDSANSTSPIKEYATIAYNQIPNKATGDSYSTIPNDFRDSIESNDSYIGKQDSTYYSNFNLEGKYGFAKSFNRDVQGSAVPARGAGSFLKAGSAFDGTVKNAWTLTKDSKFTGDKINSIDIIKDFTNPKDVYTKADSKDLVKFYFADGEMQGNNLKRIMAFRATITGLTDTFSPSWGSVQIMGRPDSVYRYESFERSISFTFTAYASTRSEMIPMWRKLNYLASFTAPDYVKNYVAGPFMRLTLGDLYQNCPGFIESLSYTFPDEGTWDIADDISGDNPDPKQLPTSVEVSVGYKIIGTHRPLNMSRMFALSPDDTKNNVDGQWLADSAFYKEPEKSGG